MSSRMKRSNLVALSGISIVMLGFVSLLASTNEAHGPVIASAGEYEQLVKHNVATAEKGPFQKPILNSDFPADKPVGAGTDRKFSYLSLIVANPVIFATSPLPEYLSALLLNPIEGEMVGSVSGEMIDRAHPLGDLNTLLETSLLQFDFSR